MAQSEEDVLSYALFPEIAKDYFLRAGREAEQAATVRASGRLAHALPNDLDNLFSGYSMIPTAPF